MSVFGVILVRIQSECRKIRTRITPNTNTFYAVFPHAFKVMQSCIHFISKYHIGLLVKQLLDIRKKQIWTDLDTTIKICDVLFDVPDFTRFRGFKRRNFRGKPYNSLYSLLVIFILIKLKHYNLKQDWFTISVY